MHLLIGTMILPTPGSIPKLAVRRCVLGKILRACFESGTSCLLVMVANLTKDLQTESKKVQKKPKNKIQKSVSVVMDRRRMPGLIARTI